MDCEVRVLSALCKVFPEETPVEAACPPLSVLQGDTASFQVACHWAKRHNETVTVSLQSPLARWCQVRAVMLSPSAYPCHAARDGDYLRTTPGLFPDRLAALEDGRIRLVHGQWRALWVDVEPDGGTPAGTYDITLFAHDDAGNAVFMATQQITVIACALPLWKGYHTEWFHADCLADYYGVSTDSDAFFDVVEPFLRAAVRRGVNTILTPLFTPPLDTAEGGERTTVQLVGVTKEADGYTFDFTRLRRWIAVCDACGVRTFEMSHLFSQWGAKYAPKIIGWEDGTQKRLFGWDTPGTGEAYRAFLADFLPALRAELLSQGVLHRCLFHISDEPGEKDLESYRQARAVVREHLKEETIIDALSEFSFYQAGIVERPVVANDAIEPFLAAGVPGLWTYYCTAQSVGVSNRFFAMPSARNRILGVQMYLHSIEGFLHWGYNFYNTMHSVRHINPYAVTDAGDAFPSGDPFLVYPGEGGQPEESIRMMVLAQAFGDLRALALLESLAGRAFVDALVREDWQGPITFSEYPRDALWLLNLRARVNGEIERRCANV